MDADDLLGAMLDFEEPGPNAAVQPRVSAAPQPVGVPQGHLMAPGVAAGVPRSPQVPTAARSPSQARPGPASPGQAAFGPQEYAQLRQRYEHLLIMLHNGQPGKRAEVEPIMKQLHASNNAHADAGEKVQALRSLMDKARQLYGQQAWDTASAQLTAAMQRRAQGQPPRAATPTHPPASPGSVAPGLRAPTPAAQQQAQAARVQQAQAQQQQLAPMQAQAAAARQPSPARAASPFPAGGVVAGQLMAQQQAAAAAFAQQQQAQVQAQVQAQQQQALQAQLQAQQPAVANAAAQAAAAQAAKRSAEAGAEPAAKRAKMGGGAATAAKKKDDDAGLTVDGLIDFDGETNQLMEGLQRERREGRLRDKTTSNQCFLSDWRLGHEFYRHIQRTGGGMTVKGECFEVLQLAFQAHMAGVVARALRCAQHRQDASRRSGDVAVTSDPRRGVTQIERREKAKAEVRLEAERAELLRLAGSKKADEETKAAAQKAKAELVGKQQASLANAAVAATLGGKAKGKANKWDKWAAAAAGGGGEGEAGGAAAGGKKKGAAGGKKGGKKGAGAGEEGGGDAGAAGGEGAAAAAAKAPAARARLAGGAGGGDDASTVQLRDVLATLERDPMYSRSGLLYSLYNRPRAGASTVAPT